MSYLTFIFGLVVGVGGAAVYNYFLGAKFAKFSAQVMKELDSIRGKK